MKTIAISMSVIVLTLLFWGCESKSAQLSEAEKEEIKKEVINTSNATTLDVNAHDADKIMQACWNDKDYVYVANGVITKGWEENLKGSTIIHSNPKNQSYSVSFDEINIKVLSREAVMLVGKGAFHNILTEEGTKSVDLVVTFLMEKIDDEWLITVGHESTPEAILVF